MGLDSEPKDKSKTMMEVVSSNNENGNLPHDSKDKFMHCVSNCEDHNFGEETLYGVGQAKISQGNEDMEINITECTNSVVDRLAVVECQDATENSSSFGGTVSGGENDSAISDAEAQSALCGVSPLGSAFDGLFQMRKRKLTDHWRRFIHPLMWRCKWLELQLKEFKSQALTYDKELAEYDQRKKFEYEKFTLEGVDVKSKPFSCQIQRKKAMKRRKRKRVEDTADLASYMSHHSLFSFYESKKSIVATAALDDDNGNLGNKTVNSNDDFGFNDGLSSLEFRDGDTWSEQILKKIDLVQSQVCKLKTRVDKVVNESPRKFASINALTGSRNRASPSESGDRIPVKSQCASSQHLSEGNMGDFFMPGSAVSSHGEVMPFPDIIEGTGQHLAGISYENTEDDVLIHNQAAKEELFNFRSGLTQQSEEPQIPIEKPKPVSTVLAPGDDLPTNPSVQLNVKLSSTSKSKRPNNKRKRGKRKSDTSRWKRLSG
ncbi:uncharacterized protein LOC111299952 [Durio zibethinus]|uniref:Uncharacterized protein LOC111299952 n=1 Tax=Durio zibethinus TaxID=66656 RepID=A0A6P5ZEM9_DURZI|nr:uncharacterized protein LOC111299952 [Durio zibethinus]XP_022751234.1 uncharacterized protein LOC111299952 [Durio zibethinus]